MPKTFAYPSKLEDRPLGPTSKGGSSTAKVVSWTSPEMLLQMMAAVIATGNNKMSLKRFKSSDDFERKDLVVSVIRDFISNPRHFWEGFGELVENEKGFDEFKNTMNSFLNANEERLRKEKGKMSKSKPEPNPNDETQFDEELEDEFEVEFGDDPSGSLPLSLGD